MAPLRLTLIAQDGVWHVESSGDVEAERIAELFGVTLLPTPYTTATPYNIVRDRIAKLNPTAEVY